MKKLIIPMIMAMLFAISSNGQTVNFNVVTDPVVPGTVEIEVNFTGAAFENVGAIQLEIGYDFDLLQYNGPGQIDKNGGSFILNEDAIDNALKIAWSNLAGGDFSDETLLLSFNYNGGFPANLVFLPSSEIANIVGSPINTDFIDDVLVPDLSNPDGTANIGSEESIAGTNVSVPVSITDNGGFDGIASAITLHITYDPDKLNYIGSANNTLGFDITESEGLVSLQKSDAVPFSFPLDDPVINLIFEYLGGGPAQIDFNPGSVITNNEGETLITQFSGGEVTLDPDFIGRFTIAKVSSDEAEEIQLIDPPGSYYELVPVDVPISAEGFAGVDVGEISLKIQYDNDKLTYDGYIANQFSGWTLGVDTDAGEISLSVTSSSGLTIDNDDLITLKFLYLSGVADITFEPATFVNETDASPVPTELIDGFVAPFTNLDLKLFLEGLYDEENSEIMRKAQDHDGNDYIDKFPGDVADQITVRLHDQDNYSTIVWSQGEVDLNTDGSATLTLPSNLDGMYYISIIHRNHIETVSADPIDFSLLNISYDFTDANTKAFGNNLKQIETGVFAIFAGDVNQEGTINIDTVMDVFNARGLLGYENFDADGDGIVSIDDVFTVFDNRGVSAITP